MIYLIVLLISSHRRALVESPAPPAGELGAGDGERGWEEDFSIASTLIPHVWRSAAAAAITAVRAVARCQVVNAARRRALIAGGPREAATKASHRSACTPSSSPHAGTRQHPRRTMRRCGCRSQRRRRRAGTFGGQQNGAAPPAGVRFLGRRGGGEMGHSRPMMRCDSTMNPHSEWSVALVPLPELQVGRHGVYSVFLGEMS
ncbi:unnamed protein product [Urochloa humidicola]